MQASLWDGWTREMGIQEWELPLGFKADGGVEEFNELNTVHHMDVPSNWRTDEDAAAWRNGHDYALKEIGLSRARLLILRYEYNVPARQIANVWNKTTGYVNKETAKAREKYRELVEWHVFTHAGIRTEGLERRVKEGYEALAKAIGREVV